MWTLLGMDGLLLITTKEKNINFSRHLSRYTWLGILAIHWNHLHSVTCSKPNRWLFSSLGALQQSKRLQCWYVDHHASSPSGQYLTPNQRYCSPLWWIQSIVKSNQHHLKTQMLEMQTKREIQWEKLITTRLSCHAQPMQTYSALQPVTDLIKSDQCFSFWVSFN